MGSDFAFFFLLLFLKRLLFLEEIHPCEWWDGVSEKCSFCCVGVFCNSTKKPTSVVVVVVLFGLCMHVCVCSSVRIWHKADVWEEFRNVHLLMTWVWLSWGDPVWLTRHRKIQLLTPTLCLPTWEITDLLKLLFRFWWWSFRRKSAPAAVRMVLLTVIRKSPLLRGATAPPSCGMTAWVLMKLVKTSTTASNWRVWVSCDRLLSSFQEAEVWTVCSVKT